MVMGQPSLDHMRSIYAEDASHAHERIAALISDELADLSPSEKIAQLHLLSAELKQTSSINTLQADGRSFSRLAALLLGAKVNELDFSSPKFVEKLADSINVVFDAINDIILGINSTFAGPDTQTETIRLVISSQIEVDESGKSLLSYLDQIKEAFAISLQAFQKATQAKLTELLHELSPQKIAELSTDSKLQIGPFRKAELFDTYERKFRSLEKLHHSGKLLEKFVREFEKNCQDLYLRREKKT